jgi:signal transduction histidine kinase
MPQESNILVVDDNIDNVQLASAILKKKNYNISLAFDGTSALKLLKDNHIDLILMDVMMPGIDGYMLCQEIKKIQELKDIPIIFITALTDTSSIVKSFESGGVDYISKPIRWQELLVRINTHLTISKLQKTLQDLNLHLEEQVAERTSQLSAANSDLNHKVLELRNAYELLSQNIADKKRLLQQMTRAIIHSEEVERTHFAQELHDGLGPILTTIKMYLQLLKNPDITEDKNKITDQSIAITEEAIVNIKEISNKLSPHVLNSYGLKAAVESFVNKLKPTSNLDFTLNLNSEERYPTDLEILFYRIIIECINNTLKHAKAQYITIELKKDTDWLCLDYTDNGIGFNITEIVKRQQGLGLNNIKNRVETFDGIFSLESEPQKGIQVHIKIPVGAS